jgi:hypothetical protein
MIPHNVLFKKEKFDLLLLMEKWKSFTKKYDIK